VFHRPPQVVASRDPALSARIVSSTALVYDEGADPSLDRPAHVRAGSSLATIGGFLAVIQDDASFVALIDLRTHRVHPVPLPLGIGGQRQFDETRGNKRFKPDLEACAVVPAEGGDLLIAFGSGSAPFREQIAVLSGWDLPLPRVAVYDALDLYAVLREARDFSGSELNVEGAVFVDGSIRLFGRGNGRPRDGLLPLDATCDLEWEALRRHLQSPHDVPPPRPGVIVQYELGSLDGLRLSFTDAASGPGVVVFSAVAEASPDVTRDGPVAGSVLGVLDAPDHLRWTVVLDSEGGRFSGKIEGLQLAPETPWCAYVIVDRDDPGAPSELCEVELSGPWYGTP
jgi:hypothetical protein